MFGPNTTTSNGLNFGLSTKTSFFSSNLKKAVFIGNNENIFSNSSVEQFDRELENKWVLKKNRSIVAHGFTTIDLTIFD